MSLILYALLQHKTLMPRQLKLRMKINPFILDFPDAGTGTGISRSRPESRKCVVSGKLGKPFSNIEKIVSSRQLFIKINAKCSLNELKFTKFKKLNKI